MSDLYKEQTKEMSKEKDKGPTRLVYSTEVGRIKSVEDKSAKVVTGDGIVRIRRETKGRNGKGVTTISGIIETETELKNIAKQLKQKCATGGAVKEGVIEIQGDHRELLKVELEKMGYQVKLAGG